jgi:hypothetical protein
MYRFGALGMGLIKAMKGWMNAKTVSRPKLFNNCCQKEFRDGHLPVVMHPISGWGFSETDSDTQPSTSTKMMMKPITVRVQASTINPRWYCHFEFEITSMKNWLTDSFPRKETYHKPEVLFHELLADPRLFHVARHQ